jgi:hypothetical protein
LLFHPSCYVDAKLEGYHPNSSVCKAQVNDWYLGNFVVGRLIGLLIVLTASGAMDKLPSFCEAGLARRRGPTQGPSLPPELPRIRPST